MAKFNMQEPVFSAHPEGPYVGQLRNFVDEGMRDGQFGPYRSAYFEIQTAELNEQGELFFPLRYYVNENAGAKSKTTLFRNAVARRTLTPEERMDFDPETLIGQEVLIQVAHFDKDGKVYARIENVMAVPKAATPPQPKPQHQVARPEAEIDADSSDQDDLPF